MISCACGKPAAAGGVRSSFQSLGVNSVKINSGLNLLGDGLTYLVVGANIIMPLAVLTGLIARDIPP